MRVHHIEQRTDAWKQLRAGKLTGSVAKDMLATVKSGEAASRRDLRFKLLAERLSGQSQENGYTNAAMIWGTEHEAEAILAYEALTGAIVEPIGFCEHDSLPLGTSPDGFLEDDGIISIKCPQTATHVRWLRAGVEPSEHVAQNSHELFVTGRAWIEFVSYDPRLPDNLRLFILRVTRTPDVLRAYEAAALTFLNEMAVEEAALRTMGNLAGTLRAAV